MNYKTLATGVAFAVLVFGSVVSAAGHEPADEDPILTRDEMMDFMEALGTDRDMLSRENVSPVYRRDIADGFLQWANMSESEGIAFLKNMVQQTTAGGPEALKHVLDQLPRSRSTRPPKPELTFGPETLDAARQEPSTVAVYGNIPAFNTQEERWDWIDTLSRTNDRIDEIHRAGDVPDEVRTYGVRAGYHAVGIAENCTAKEAVMDEVYGLFERAAHLEGMEDVPVVFEEVSDALLIEYTRDAQYRPIRGGIQCQNVDPFGYQYESTIGYSAERNGDRGYVVSGHLCAGPNPTQINYAICQPTLTQENLTGYVTDASGHYVYSDSAFVNTEGYCNTSGMIYLYSSGSTGMVQGNFDPSEGQHVYMSGITSGLVDGTVTAINKVVPSYSHTTLYDQIYTTLQADHGDSGAPVFNKNREILPSLWLVDVNGVLVGDYQGHTVVSPQSGINTDIGATPVMYWE
ncbi:MAG: hypothetical protein PHU95_02335 [Candidatus Thermoplasmatota archaeon]|nr:hypothetical protein [Candidatus Thermoplasmatota archaeon]MDD5778270.1 hypothetical protein [Candidatus Thermoplasmatota archaeon]